MLAPETILRDRYRITYVIDEQSDAVIYRAIDIEQSLRVLVSELPQPHEHALGDVGVLATQMVGLSAPALLGLRDHFAQDLNYYLVCDDPGGQDLERVARDRGGPLPEAEVLTAVERLLTTLDILHTRAPALLLGDVRPTDLWSSLDGGLFLTPFPMARHVGLDASSYRAPELHDSSAEPTTTSDVYALGAVLYQLLTGWAPTTAAQRQAATPLNPPRMLNARVSVLAEQLVLRALELKPVNRYQQAREMRSALETVRLMAGRPLGATAPIDPSQPASAQPGMTPPPPPPNAPPPVLTTPLGAAPEPANLYGPPPPAPPPARIPTGPLQPQPAGPAPAAAAPTRQGFQLSNGCLLGVVAALTVMALAICVLGAWVGLIVWRQSAAPLPGGVTLQATAVPPEARPESAVSAPDPTTAALIANGAPFRQGNQLQDAPVGATAYSPAGDLIAVSLGGALELRDSASLEPRGSFEGHSASVSALAFSPDGTLLASGAQDDPIIQLWDVATGQAERSLEGHDGWLRSLAFSPDGTLLASGSTDQTIIIWEVASGRALFTLTGHSNFLGHVSFSPDGTLLASASRDGTVRIWEVSSGRELEERRYTAPLNPQMGAPYWLTGVSFSPDGERLAVGSISGSLYLLDPANGQLVRELQGHEGWVVIRGVGFSPDGRLLASASLDGTVRLWNPTSGASRGILDHAGLQLLGLSWSPDSASLVVTSDTAGSMTLWDVAQGEQIQRVTLAQGAITALAYAASGEALVTGGLNGMVKVHLLDDGQSIPLSGGAPTSQYVTFANESELVAVNDSGAVMLINLASGGGNRELAGLEGLALTVDVTHDQQLVAAGNDRGEVAIWHRESGALQRTLRGLDGAVFALAFNRDGTQIAAVSNRTSERPQVIVWDLLSGEQLTTFSGHSATITGLEMPAGQDVVASTSSDGTLKLWQAGNGEELRSLTAPPERGWYSSMAFSPDGTLMATGSLSGHVELWEVASGTRLSEVELGGVGAILGLSFRADSTQIAAATRDGGVILLDAVVQ